MWCGDTFSQQWEASPVRQVDWITTWSGMARKITSKVDNLWFIVLSFVKLSVWERHRHDRKGRQFFFSQIRVKPSNHIETHYYVIRYRNSFGWIFIIYSDHDSQIYNLLLILLLPTLHLMFTWVIITFFVCWLVEFCLLYHLIVCKRLNFWRTKNSQLRHDLTSIRTSSVRVFTQ